MIRTNSRLLFKLWWLLFSIKLSLSMFFFVCLKINLKSQTDNLLPHIIVVFFFFFLSTKESRILKARQGNGRDHSCEIGPIIHRITCWIWLLSINTTVVFYFWTDRPIMMIHGSAIISASDSHVNASPRNSIF